ncbi:phospholipid-binding protein MlaC [Burkholderia sp. Se-20378]|uniref:MlaC/ttg2D family ABC transporter substrate-binding protein n=1 Tax=Burkholderia sp. Se-20378 TaxID=2703899 RepID=UPI00197E53C8|nr:ABC transporter substrate-binding protein [Burkholderia sp. Se-20378]MBN3769526.1 ABC transporter substrate-binding protein [Burkholderia sp. Se-20378]
MRNQSRKLFVCCSLVLGSIACPAICSASDSGNHVRIEDQTDPSVLIQTATEEVQDELRKRAIDPADTSRIMDIANRDILPYTDIRRTTRLATGRHWREATPAQQDELTAQFQRLLIHTYSGALGLLTPDQKFQYPGTHGDANRADTVVRTVAIYNGQPVEIDYRLYRTANGWRVYDLNLLGVWLVQIYRQQFSDEIGKHGIDGLIALLAARNADMANHGANVKANAETHTGLVTEPGSAMRR